MQQPSESSLSSQRTRPALPKISLPSAVVVTRTLRSSRGLALSDNPYSIWGKIVLLLLSLMLVEIGLLALYPLFIGLNSSGDALQQALPALFPWLARLDWTASPFAQTWLGLFVWLSPLTASGNRHLIISCTALALIGALLAALVGKWTTRRPISRFTLSILCGIILLGSLLFGITSLFVPVNASPLMQPFVLDGLYGRMIAFYHLSPYVSAPTAVQHDLLLPLVHGPGGLGEPVPTGGPLWLDICLLIAILAGNSIAKILLGFRLLGLVAHIVNVILLWSVLGRLKPTLRVTGTLLYAWNPVVLLFSIVFVHQMGILVLCLLLATLCLQRESPTLAWVLILLGALINGFYFLLLPIFLRLLLRESRILYMGRRLLWWLGMSCITLLVIALAYAPYWHGWGSSGLLNSVRQSFLPTTAVNSLDAALLHLPVILPAPIMWLLMPPHWSAFVLVLEACLLLLGIWLIDTLPLALLFSSWVLLIGATLLPVYWPWSILPPLALAICCINRRTLELAVLLTLGALLCTWFWLAPTPPVGQGLVILALPLLLWGWVVFFTSTWRMTHRQQEPEPVKKRKVASVSFSRPSWLSRPSRSRSGKS